jgi:hypothetical protein
VFPSVLAWLSGVPSFIPSLVPFRGMTR